MEKAQTTQILENSSDGSAAAMGALRCGPLVMVRCRGRGEDRRLVMPEVASTVRVGWPVAELRQLRCAQPPPMRSTSRGGGRMAAGYGRRRVVAGVSTRDGS
jgi:hypothetical protein